MADGPTTHLAAALQIHREIWQHLQDALATREDAGQPFAAGIEGALHGLRACEIEIKTLLAHRQSNDAYRAADLEVNRATEALAVEESNVKAEAISLRRAETIGGATEIEGYTVRTQVRSGVEITDAAEFALQVKDKLPDLLDVLAPRTPSPKIVKEHAATLAQLEISGWQRTAKVSATFAVLEKEADGTADTDA